MAMMTTQTVEFEGVPGVDLVAGSAHAELEAQLFTDRVLTVAGSVHRRFLDRRSELLRSRLTSQGGASTTTTSWTSTADQQLELLRGPDFCGSDGGSWAGRLAAHRLLASPPPETGTPVTRIRGWDRTEPSVLVDGRAIAGCILDAAVALEHQARRFEAGEQPFAVCIPDLRTTAEARTWKAMLNLTQDRLGIPRDAVPVLLSLETAESVDHAAGILSEFRDSCVGLCIAEGAQLDEVRVKEVAADHGVRWVGAIPGSIDHR